MKPANVGKFTNNNEHEEKDGIAEAIERNNQVVDLEANKRDTISLFGHGCRFCWPEIKKDSVVNCAKQLYFRKAAITWRKWWQKLQPLFDLFGGSLAPADIMWRYCSATWKLYLISLTKIMKGRLATHPGDTFTETSKKSDKGNLWMENYLRLCAWTISPSASKPSKQKMFL